MYHLIWTLGNDKNERNHRLATQTEKVHVPTFAMTAHQIAIDRNAANKARV